MNTNGSVIAMTLEEQVNVLAWLHAEQRAEYIELVNRVTNVGTVLASLLAQQAGPQLQQNLANEILSQMMSGGAPAGP